MSEKKRGDARKAARAPEGMVRPAEAARYTGYSPATIYRLVADGTLPAERFARRDIWIKVTDLDNLRQPVTAPAEAWEAAVPAPDLSVAEAARESGFSVATIYRYVADGVLPAHRLGRKAVRIKRSDLDKITKPIRSRGAEVVADPIREAALKVVADAPALTAEQLSKITALLGRVK